MSSCVGCDVPLPDEEALCWACFRRVIPQIVWPDVQKLLAALWSSEEFAALKHALAQTLQERDSDCTIDVSPAQALARQVNYAQKQWRELWARDIALIQSVNEMTVRDAFTDILLIVILQRRRYRRQLRQWFRVDMQRDRVLRKNPFPLLPKERELFDVTFQSYWQYEVAFCTCLAAMLKAKKEGRRRVEIAETGVQAMADLLQDRPRFIALTLDAPDVASQERATILLSGFIKPQIRLYGSLRRVLGEAGDPRTVLNEMLPGFVTEAYRAGTKDTGALVRHVRRLLDQTRRKGRKKAQHNVPEPESLEARRTRKRNAPDQMEEWYTKQEAAGLLEALIPRARLSPGEAEYLSLHRRGLSYSAIATQKKVHRGTVSKTLSRATQKLRDYVPGEVGLRLLASIPGGLAMTTSAQDIFASEIPELLQRHLEHLTQGSGLPLDVIRERGYRSILGKKQLAGVGFAPSQQRPPGLLLPVCPPDGSNGLCCYRPDVPRTTKDGKVLKYEFPRGATARLDVPPRCRPLLGDPSVSLWFTEGQKKADALAAKGVCVVCLLGVWNFKGRNEFGGVTLLTDFDLIAWNGREVRIVFDSDLMTKRPVRDALERLTENLQRKGAHVTAVYLPPAPHGGKIGVDDFLLTHTLAELEAIIDTPRPQPQPAPSQVELLDEAPASIRRPLALLHGHAYAAIWPHVRVTRTEALDKQGNVVRLATPEVTTEQRLFIVRDDGVVFGHGRAGQYLGRSTRFCPGYPLELSPRLVGSPASARRGVERERHGTRHTGARVAAISGSIPRAAWLWLCHDRAWGLRRESGRSTPPGGLLCR